jgi:hydrogenase-4 component E
MDSALEIIIIVLFLTNMALFGISRVRTCINLVAIQGMLLGIFAILEHAGSLSLRIILIAVASFVIKGFVFPILLQRAMKESNILREMEPFVGYTVSILLGISLLWVSVWLSGKLPIPENLVFPMVVPASFMTMFTGLFLVVARKKALTQAIGYIVLENGLYLFGITLVGGIPALVEFGILLDAFVAVFVMGIAIFNINREFDHMDADQLSSLKG